MLLPVPVVGLLFPPGIFDEVDVLLPTPLDGIPEVLDDEVVDVVPNIKYKHIKRN